MPDYKQLVDIELELADLIAAERVVGRILAGPGGVQRLSRC
jgi:hypothetical protein